MGDQFMPVETSAIKRLILYEGSATVACVCGNRVELENPYLFRKVDDQVCGKCSRRYRMRLAIEVAESA